MRSYTCEQCGESYDKHDNHSAFCPGDPNDRLSDLEAAVLDLTNRVMVLEIKKKRKVKKP